MDWPSLLTPSLGAGGVVVLVVLMLLRGDLVPRKQVDAMLKSKDEAIAFWREAHDLSEEQHRQKDRLIAGLMDTTRTTRNVLTALSGVTGLEEDGHVPAHEEG